MKMYFISVLVSIFSIGIILGIWEHNVPLIIIESAALLSVLLQTKNTFKKGPSQ